MKGKRLIFSFVVLSVFLAGCVKEQPCDLCDELKELENRVSNLEEATDRLEVLIQQGVLIESVTQIEGGWRITFTGGEPDHIDIMHGITPEGGDNGKTPLLKVEKNDDGSTTMWVDYGDGKGWQDTGVDLTGPTGPSGQTPYIGDDGYWWIGETNTGIKAQGGQGVPGDDGDTPYIGENGNWWIGTTDTGVKAQGAQGVPGENGVTPRVGENGNWWIGTTDTGVKAQGAQGVPGENGVTPRVGENGNWWIGSIDTGVKAQGAQGVPGENGVTPRVGENGNWWIGSIDTGVKAQGAQGVPGENGVTPRVGENGNWWIGSTDTGVKAQGAQGVPGENGVTPRVGENGNWWIGTTDTGVKAQGPQGPQGSQGPQGPQGSQGPQGTQGAPGADGVSPKIEVRDNEDGSVTIWYNVTKDPDTGLYDPEEWVDTQFDISKVGPVLSITDNLDGTVTFTMNDDKDPHATYTFEKASSALRFEIMTTGKVITNEGAESVIRFRVNPSTAWVPTGAASTVPTDPMFKWELDAIETRAGYVNTSPNFTLVKIERMRAEHEGEYLATVRYDKAAIGKSEYVLALVLNTQSAEKPVLVSSGPFSLGPVTARTLPNIDDITVPEDIGELVTPEHSYVGAFWRRDQIGERLIRIPVPAENAGKWGVQVLDYGPDFVPGDILFSTTPSLDPGVGTNNPADMIASDATYRVTDGATYVVGEVPAGGGHIFFRIGLRTKWSEQTAYNENSRPARYATILLSFGGDGYQYHQKLFLRQGEGADYLMTDSDPDMGGSIVRTGTLKWSPFNLTASDMTESDEYVALAERGGTPTDYPTKAGALFQFSSPNARYAYHPTITPKASLTTWDSNSTTPWTVDQEACPLGYRRPTTGTAISSSEIARSLMADLSSDDFTNSTWGYYADGYFDRRPLGLQESSAVGPGDPTLSAVAMNTKEVAYRGRLYFNPNETSGHRNASLFFPAAATRNHTGGVLYFAGTNGHYWTSTSVGGSGGLNGRALSASKANPSYEYSTDRSMGYSVRCVQIYHSDPPQPPEPQNKRITWDGAAGRYVLTTDPTDAGLYFKLGSVTGVFTGQHAVQTLPATNTYPFSNTDVAWSPVSITETGKTGWVSIPTYAQSDFLMSPNTITPPLYHNAVNVKAGKGDPCRLVGLDLEYIADTDADDLVEDDIDNGLWRLPTSAEWSVFTGIKGNVSSYTAHWTTLSGSGVLGGMFPNTTDGDETTFLPAVGERDLDGTIRLMGTEGFYWSSTLSNYNHGYGLAFNTKAVSTLYSNGYINFGWPVRCVRQ